MFRPIAALFLTTAFGAVALASEPEETDPEPSWNVRVAVVGDLREATSAPVGSSSTAVDPSRLTGAPSALTEVVSGLAGVAENGQGGQLQVFSIRGVSRQRVLNLVAGMRIYSERRAGASVSFVDPLLMDEVEVLRGPATTLHGAGALGGVVQVFPRSFDGPSFRTGYDSDGDLNYQVVGYGDESWSVGFARRHAVDGRTADGERIHDGFGQYSATLQRRWLRGPMRYDVTFIPTFGERIGKAGADFPERTTTYPRERHGLLKFSAASRKGWRVAAHVHDHDLKTEVVEGAARSNVVNDSLDFGVRWERDSAPGDDLALRWGFESTGHGVDSIEDGVVRTLDDAQELESGGFVTLRWNGGTTELEAGGRVTLLRQENAGASAEHGSAASGFFGVSAPVGKRAVVRGSVSTGLRFPSLSERFFRGTTGSGQVIGNPDLDRERSLNVQLSSRWLGKTLLLETALFHNRIDDYIERIEIAPGVRSFENRTAGTLRGIELEGWILPDRSWSVGFGGHLLDGRDRDDRPLADVPADRLFASVRGGLGGWSYETRLTHRASKEDAGSGERPIPSAEVLDVRVGRKLTEAWSFAVHGRNLLDERFFSSADDNASAAAGRSIGLQLLR